MEAEEEQEHAVQDAAAAAVGDTDGEVEGDDNRWEAEVLGLRQDEETSKLP